MDNAVFRLLKNTGAAHTSEIEALQRAVQRLSSALAPHLGPQGQVLLGISEQLTHELNQHRYGANEFHAVFSGKGPMAQRLCDASVIDELLYGKHTPAKETRVAKVLTAFNYLPSQEPADIHEIHHFCQHVFELVQLGNLEIAPFQPAPSLSCESATTGFYWQDDGHGGRSHTLVLAGKIKGTELRLALFVGTYSPAALYVYHPQECTWIQYDGTCVLPGMRECLENELESAYSALTHASQSRNWPAEWADACAQAREVLARSQVLPMTLRGFVRVSPEDRQIVVNEAGHRVLFQSVSGDYPNDSATIMSQMSGDGKVAFTVQLESLPPMIQCRLVTAVQDELAHLMRSIETAEELSRQDAAAP